MVYYINTLYQAEQESNMLYRRLFKSLGTIGIQYGSAQYPLTWSFHLDKLILTEFLQFKSSH